MKILYLADQYKPECYTGTVKFIENIMKNFSKNNEVKLVSYCENHSKDYLTRGDIKYWIEHIDSIECVKFSTSEKYRINYELYNDDVYKFAVKIIEDFNPDIIHICHPRRIASFIQAAIKLNKKYLITCTDNFLICPRSFFFTKSCEICVGRHKEKICANECSIDENIINSNKLIVESYVNNAYALITPSKFQAKMYREYFDKEILVINHGNRTFESHSFKKVYPKEKLIFGFNGSSNTLKGLIIAIEAFNNLTEINVELHVYGDCDDTIKLISGENIKFFGKYNNSDITKILSTIDVLICSSIWYENYPFVITEAFMNSVPVIASNAGGMKELVKNCFNGFTFNLGDAEHLAQIIKYLFSSQSIITQLLENLEQYKYKSIESEMKQYCKIYENCLNGNIVEENKVLVMDAVWEKIIKDRFKISSLEKYKKCINETLIKYNYFAPIDAVYRFIIRLNNMEKILNAKEDKSIIVWGAGTSGILTIDIIKKLYPWIKIKFVIDKYKNEGFIKEIPLRSINVLDKEEFDYLFICTSPGKKEADEVMGSLNKEVNRNYNYGICVE